MKDSTLAADLWKWAFFALLFGGGGVLLITYHRDIWRYIRWMFGGFG
jgi:hypothetical protein